MVKRELYASISLLTVVAFLSGCGDSDGTESSPQTPAASAAAQQPLEVTLEDARRETKREEEVIAEAVAAIAAVPDLAPPASTPSLYEKAQDAQRDVLRIVGEMTEQYDALLSTAKKRGSLNVLEAEHKAFLEKVAELEGKVSVFRSAAFTFLGSTELSAYDSKSQGTISQNFQGTLNGAAQVKSGLPTAAIEKEIERRIAQLELLRATGESGLLSSNFGDSLRKEIEKVSALKFGAELPGHPIKFMPLVTAGAKESEASKRLLIQELFSKKEMVDLVKAGSLDAVAAKVYGDVVSPRMALEFVYKVGTFSNDTMYYTFAEIEKIIENKGTDDATTLALAGKTDVEGLNGKPYPVFDAHVKPAKKRTMPELVKVKALEAEVALKVSELVQKFLLENDVSQQFFPVPEAKAATALALSSGSIKDLSGTVSFRDARTSLSGRVDGRSLSVNGVSGQAVELGMPLFVNVKGNVDSAKATEAATGSVAYRLGNTVIGAIQGYANSGAGFELDGHQLESSVVASHSFGGLFIEGQAGSVAAASVHGSDWNGVRSQLTVGFDTLIVSPFVQVAYRQLDRDGIHQLTETTGYVGLDMEVANLTADTYSLHTRLLAKVGYGEQNWSKDSKDLGSIAGVRGSVEWTTGVNLNSGISFSTNLGLDTLSGSSAGVKVGLDR